MTREILTLDKIGISFRSLLSAEQVSDTYIQPLRAALKRNHDGIYSNYLRQVDPAADVPTEHLLVFEVNDFKVGLRTLRTELEKLGVPAGAQFQNLNPSTPGY